MMRSFERGRKWYIQDGNNCNTTELLPNKHIANPLSLQNHRDESINAAGAQTSRGMRMRWWRKLAATRAPNPSPAVNGHTKSMIMDTTYANSMAGVVTMTQSLIVRTWVWLAGLFGIESQPRYLVWMWQNEKRSMGQLFLLLKEAWGSYIVKSKGRLLQPRPFDLQVAFRSPLGHRFLFLRASRNNQFKKPQYSHILSVGRFWVALLCGLSPPQIKEAMTMVFDAFSRRKLHVPSSTNESRGPYCVCIRVVKLNLWLIYRSIREISVHPKVPFAINSSPQISHKLV